MYITQVYKYLHELWRYVIGTTVTFVFWQLIGAIPLFIVLMVKKASTGQEFPKTMPEMATMLGSNLFLFLMILTFGFGLFGLLLSTKLLHKQSIRSLTTTRKKVDWKRILVGFSVVVILNLIYFGVLYSISSEGLVWNFKLAPFLVLLAISIFLLPIQTSLEEYLFRGYLMQGIGVNLRESKSVGVIVLLVTIFPFLYIAIKGIFAFGILKTLAAAISLCLLLYPIVSLLKIDILQRKWVPLLFTSVIFGMMHILNPEVAQLGYISMVFYVGTGLLLGIMTLMDEGLELALGYHAGNNILTALLVTTDWSALQTEAIFVDTGSPQGGFFDVVFPVLVMYPFVLLIFAKIYKWKNWKEKLFGTIDPKPELQDVNQ